MGGEDIAGIVIGVVAALISLVALGYTICSDCKNKKIVDDAENYQKENDKKMKELREELNSAIKEQSKVLSNGLENISKNIALINSNKSERFLINEEELRDNKVQFTPSQKELEIYQEEGLYMRQYKQIEKNQQEQKRKNSVVKTTKKK